jgi:hypothetical protein
MSVESLRKKSSLNLLSGGCGGCGCGGDGAGAVSAAGAGGALVVGPNG